MENKIKESLDSLENGIKKSFGSLESSIDDLIKNYQERLEILNNSLHLIRVKKEMSKFFNNRMIDDHLTEYENKLVEMQNSTDTLMVKLYILDFNCFKNNCEDLDLSYTQRERMVKLNVDINSLKERFNV